MSCRHVREWLHREASSLDEAQRLQLDDHLATCEACRGDRARMQLVHRAGQSLDAPAEARMYDRAIARALLEGPRAVAPVRTAWMLPLAIGAAVAIAIAAALVFRTDEDQASYNLAKQERERQRQTVPPPPVVLPDAEIEMAVDPIASAFEVARDVANTARAQVVIAASAVARALTFERDDVHLPAPAIEPVADVLARARTQLAAKQFADAERTASSVLPRAKNRDEAEARTILADVAQASGDFALASTLYQEVAAKFASLPAGESALYAAARVEARRGGDARPLLEQYLAKYPRGRFVVDARRLLLPKENR